MTPDPELVALGNCSRELESLSDSERRRVLWYLAARYISFATAEAIETMAAGPRQATLAPTRTNTPSANGNGTHVRKAA